MPRPCSNAEVQTTWRLLDYIAVDYREAVRARKVNPPNIGKWPNSRPVNKGCPPARQSVARPCWPTRRPEQAIGAKGPTAIAARAHRLAARLLAAYPVRWHQRHRIPRGRASR
jgi:high-affinity iron transporter